jgi:hypothetical protein
MKDIVKDPTTSTNHHQTCPCFVLGMGHETIPNAAEMTQRYKLLCTQMQGHMFRKNDTTSRNTAVTMTKQAKDQVLKRMHHRCSQCEGH